MRAAQNTLRGDSDGLEENFKELLFSSLIRVVGCLLKSGLWHGTEVGHGGLAKDISVIIGTMAEYVASLET